MPLLFLSLIHKLYTPLVPVSTTDLYLSLAMTKLHYSDEITKITCEVAPLHHTSSCDVCLLSIPPTVQANRTLVDQSLPVIDEPNTLHHESADVEDVLLKDTA